MAEKLARYGWQYIVVDHQWYDPEAKGFKCRMGVPFAMDEWGRWDPSTNRFPPGFRALADYVHSKDLKFGLRLMNAGSQPQPTTIHLRGARRVSPTGKAIVLSSENPTDEKSFDEPTKVSPLAETIQNVGATFAHTLPGNSVTILRIQAAQ